MRLCSKAGNRSESDDAVRMVAENIAVVRIQLRCLVQADWKEISELSACLFSNVSQLHDVQFKKKCKVVHKFSGGVLVPCATT